ncbi:hypothetical protein B0H10DRAFT_1786047 [Mycena sp. CBHHK59/15]|nr:hypothetical protein B0H10DRAFT_1786047 [Mycena sp. CBHHK59/15]
MWNGTRFYVGEILDVYKKEANSRHGSMPNATSTSGLSYLSLRVYLPLIIVIFLFNPFHVPVEPEETRAPLFSCHEQNSRIHTHTKIEHLVFHLGPNVFEKADKGVHRTLTSHVAFPWTTPPTLGSVSREVKKLTLKIKPSK